MSESDREAIDRYHGMSFEDVHAGHWTALLTIAADWFDLAQSIQGALCQANVASGGGVTSMPTRDWERIIAWVRE